MSLGIKPGRYPCQLTKLQQLCAAAQWYAEILFCEPALGLPAPRSATRGKALSIAYHTQLLTQQALDSKLCTAQSGSVSTNDMHTRLCV
jgi:hypothetical protein